MSGLINGAKIYFTDKSGLVEIFASPDGQYFYEKGTCLSYCTNNNLKLPICIKRSDVFPPKPEKVEVKAEAKEINSQNQNSKKNRKRNGNTK